MIYYPGETDNEKKGEKSKRKKKKKKKNVSMWRHANICANSRLFAKV